MLTTIFSISWIVGFNLQRPGTGPFVPKVRIFSVLRVGNGIESGEKNTKRHQIHKSVTPKNEILVTKKTHNNNTPLRKMKMKMKDKKIAFLCYLIFLYYHFVMMFIMLWIKLYIYIIIQYLKYHYYYYQYCYSPNDHSQALYKLFRIQPYFIGRYIRSLLVAMLYLNYIIHCWISLDHFIIYPLKHIIYFLTLSNQPPIIINICTRKKK